MEISNNDYGKMVSFSSVLERKELSLGYGRGYNTRKYWKAVETNGEGIFLGVRNLQNGEREWTDEYIAFSPTEYIKAALVSYAPNRNPVYVPIESINLLTSAVSE